MNDSRSRWRFGASRRANPTTPGRLRRMRWLLTALFTALTAACLLVLATVAASIDSHSRERALDDGVDRVVTGLARVVYWNADGTIDLETLREDDLAQGNSAVAVMVRGTDGRWREGYGHLRSTLPADLTAPSEETAAAEDTVFSTMGNSAGQRIRVAAAPVYDNDAAISAVVFAGSDPAPSQRDHRSLVLALEFGGLALIALAAVIGHLLSGVSTRPAVRMLAEQERFLADASHELRTPLATLRLYLDAALRDPQDSRRAVTEARSLTDRMGRLVTGLLARTRTETGLGELDSERLHLDQLVEGVVAECGVAGIELRTEPTVVQADPDLLALAVRNLIDNALVHGGTPVEITVAEHAVTVRDHGPGLDPDLADPFAHGSTGAGGRHGIGLSLVQWVARAHSGSVALGSAPDGGTIATLTLPAPPQL
ncbi:sensor histidine kinase [Nocardia acidivorans]|uniref:sensor histidine kinase n=1 Tax=Nocardia acidivorans TaxID=404580 RepID=UPI000A597C21|nr:HAMP domain-containing sensor histidine kinase [Nocardia acidivorans]